MPLLGFLLWSGHGDMAAAPAPTTADLTVNAGATDRKEDYYTTIGKSLSATAATRSGRPITVNPPPSAGTATNLVSPKYRQTLTYDLDGNLTFDGIWTYEWDVENRLKAMALTNLSSLPDSQRKKLEFTHDHLGRRATKTVSTWNGSAFTGAVTTRYLYDGWNLVAELDGSGNVLRSYLWGQDLSGTLDEAGGIGGLLVVVDHVPATDTYHFVAYDGNGNITALVNATDQSTSARYEYSPFGELIRATGPLATTNPFRWSTKFWDEESGLVYYGRRYYAPTLGRWINRDPIEEEGGVSLYVFTSNRPQETVDPLGRQVLNSLDKLIFAGFHAELASAPIVALSTVQKLNRVAGWFGRSSAWLRVIGSPRWQTTVRNALSFTGVAAVAKLTTISKVGDAAYNLLTGEHSPTATLEGDAEDFVHHALHGDTSMADLDAAVFAARVTNEMVASPLGILGIITTRAPAAYYPSYAALAAWETLQTFQEVVNE